jgi:hypothetical protein
MTYHVLHRRWPVGKRVWWPLLMLELAVLIPLLVLFGVQQPDLFRTQFWRIGYNYGFNSNPNIVIFAMVNAQPLPSVPFVWSKTLTNFNVAISVLGLFILLVKLITLIMKVCYPVIALGINTSLVALWAVSVYGQAGPDYADPERPSPVPWYLSKGCRYAEPYGMANSCYMAKGTLAVTVVMLAVMLANFAISVWAMLPSETQTGRDDDDDDDEYDTRGKGPATESKNATVEMRHMMPASPQPIFTPRTQAFHTLDNNLPRGYR